ncbi:hypothetical protein AWC38_SpisGene23728 [Stylophora pistillata]|uniref:Uncharacterized protein n=1 Tax=Stylophora pistillata TaxID=50429 RepID=A0A2B4R1U6_STYPI|nr:hypothetical protein AWC38_SpisGene23728 [Stylophora pistillata]
MSRPSEPTLSPIQHTLKRDSERREDKCIFGTCGIWKRTSLHDGTFVGTGSLVKDLFYKLHVKVHLITSAKVISSKDLRGYFLHLKTSKGKDKEWMELVSIVSDEVVFKSSLAILPVDPNKLGFIRKRTSGLLNHRPFTIYTIDKEGLRNNELLCHVVEESENSFVIRPYQVMGIADEETYLVDHNSMPIESASLYANHRKGLGAPITTRVKGEAVVVGALTKKNNEAISFVLFSQIDRARPFTGTTGIIVFSKPPISDSATSFTCNLRYGLISVLTTLQQNKNDPEESQEGGVEQLPSGQPAEIGEGHTSCSEQGCAAGNEGSSCDSNGKYLVNRKVAMITKLEKDLQELNNELKAGYDSIQDQRVKRLKPSLDSDSNAKRTFVAKALDFTDPSTCTSLPPSPTVEPLVSLHCTPQSSSRSAILLPTLPVSPIVAKKSPHAPTHWRDKYIMSLQTSVGGTLIGQSAGMERPVDTSSSLWGGRQRDPETKNGCERRLAEALPSNIAIYPDVSAPNRQKPLQKCLI